MSAGTGNGAGAQELSYVLMSAGTGIWRPLAGWLELYMPLETGRFRMPRFPNSRYTVTL